MQKTVREKLDKCYLMITSNFATMYSINPKGEKFPTFLLFSSTNVAIFVALKSHLMSLPSKRLPPLSWLRAYSWKKDLISDFMSGLIVAIMQVPHSKH